MQEGSEKNIFPPKAEGGGICAAEEGRELNGGTRGRCGLHGPKEVRKEKRKNKSLTRKNKIVKKKVLFLEQKRGGGR